MDGWSFYDAHEKFPILFNDHDLNIEFWNLEDKVQGDFRFTWEILGNEIYPQLHAFDDSWKAIYKYGQNFLKLLSDLDNQNVSKKELKEKLLEIGFVER